MKSIFFLAFYAILGSIQTNLPTNVIVGQHQLSLEEAERILGESAILKERTNDTKNDMYVSKTTFTAKAVEEKTQKQGNVYYMIERYTTEEDATKTIQSFIESNQNDKGFELLADCGDQAFFHTDKHNFCLIVVRKANKMIRIKVNKVTAKTSFVEVRKIGKELMGRL